MKLKKWIESPNFRPRVVGLMAAMPTLALLLNTAVAAAGELPDIGIDLSKAQPLSDSEMGQERQINGGRDESASPSIATEIVRHGDRCGGPYIPKAILMRSPLTLAQQPPAPSS